jgi:hypothetical protein
LLLIKDAVLLLLPLSRRHLAVAQVPTNSTRTITACTTLVFANYNGSSCNGKSLAQSATCNVQLQLEATRNLYDCNQVVTQRLNVSEYVNQPPARVMVSGSVPYMGLPVDHQGPVICLMHALVYYSPLAPFRTFYAPLGLPLPGLIPSPLRWLPTTLIVAVPLSMVRRRSRSRSLL